MPRQASTAPLLCEPKLCYNWEFTPPAQAWMNAPTQSCEYHSSNHYSPVTYSHCKASDNIPPPSG
ncbi:hypothetical protein [Rubritalea tangerina]|uniref:hypothetical protein n=1 Tax=Rubritalea tangerina TaxID=430798 RepID=UPI0036242786